MIKESITQRDMALTQFGFIGYALVTPEQISLTNEEDEREALNHFWRVVGRLLGIDDKINICRVNAKETTELCRQLIDNVFAKEMIASPPGFEHMTRVMLDGMWTLDVSLDYDAFMIFWYTLSGLKCKFSLFKINVMDFILLFVGIFFCGLFFMNKKIMEVFNFENYADFKSLYFENFENLAPENLEYL